VKILRSALIGISASVLLGVSYVALVKGYDAADCATVGWRMRNFYRCVQVDSGCVNELDANDLHEFNALKKTFHSCAAARGYRERLEKGKPQ
jgi:hypothetical protein